MFYVKAQTIIKTDGAAVNKVLEMKHDIAIKDLKRRIKGLKTEIACTKPAQWL